MAEDNVMIEKVEQIADRGAGHLPTRRGPELTPGERAEELWGLFSEYSTFRRGLYRKDLTERKGARSIKEVPEEEKNKVLEDTGQNPLIQRLEGEISSLWQDPQVKGIFVARVRESLREREEHTGDLKEYRRLKGNSRDLEDEYFDLLRNQFLMRQMTPTLRAMDMSRNRAEKTQISHEIVALETTGGMPEALSAARGGLDKEHADLTALLGYERIFDYHRQLKKEGIVLTASRESLLDEVATNTSSGTWMLLSGETGSGKTTFAKTTSHILNGEPPQYASGERWGDVRTLIGTKTMDAQGQVYYEFGPLTVALTGFHNSLEMDDATRNGQEAPGKVFLADELNKFDQDALFGALKIVSTLRPGEEFSFKELPGVRLRMAKKGFAIIATMNPSSVRYDRKELDPALERLFYNGKRIVDYLPMTDQNPELYEVFLAALMDDNGRIRVSRDELAPAYKDVEDQAAKLTKQELDPNVTKHGSLYRFALAVAEIHKSFNQKESAARTATDDGFLEKTVLDMGVLVEWMNGYSTQVEGGLSLTAYLERKLSAFYDNIESVNDREIFARVFTHFGFNNPNLVNAPKPRYSPLTPIEIGYLTPRTPRGVRKEGEEILPKTELYIDPDTGEEINYLIETIKDDAGEYIFSGQLIRRDGKEYIYLGIDADSGETIFIPYQERMGFINITSSMDKSRTPESAKSQDRMVERAKEILGIDFLGVEAVRAMEAKLKAKGVNAEFSLDVPPLPYSEKDLELAKQNGEMLVLRPNGMKVNGARTDLTIMNFRQLFDQDPVGSGTHAIYPNTWHNNEVFATGPADIFMKWALVKKEVLPNSKNKTYTDQDGVLVAYQDELVNKGANNNTIVRRRTAFESMWDTMLYYTNTGQKLLPNIYDWTQTKTSGGSLVNVGDFDSNGLNLGSWNPSFSNALLGVCPSR